MQKIHTLPYKNDISVSVDKKLEEINRLISQQNSNTDCSLYQGKGGIVLYKAYYNQVTGTKFFSLSNDLQDIFDSISELDSFTYANGFAGIGWVYKHLAHYNLIEVDKTILDPTDQHVAEAMINMMKEGNYDFLHGALGIAWYLLEFNKTKKYDHWLAEFIILLENKSISQGLDTMFWSDSLHLSKQMPCNLGLAHGLPSIVIFLSECIKKNIESERCIGMIKKILNKINQYRRKEPLFGSYYPNTDMSSDANLVSRLAWCYGDMGIAIALWKVSAVLDEKELEAQAIQLMRKSALRRTYAETHIQDAQFCHGSSGAGQLYSKFYMHTKENLLGETWLYWINQTLKYPNTQTLLPGQFPGDENILPETDLGLLEGISGIGLTLLSTKSSAPLAWDRCFLLF